MWDQFLIGQCKTIKKNQTVSVNEGDLLNVSVYTVHSSPII